MFPSTPSELVERLQRRPRVIGLLEYGCARADDPAIRGDYDLVVFLETREPVVESLHLFAGDVPVDLNLRSLEEVERMDRAAGFDSILLEGRIIHDPTGRVSAALEALRRRHEHAPVPAVPPGEVARIRHGTRHAFDKVRRRRDDPTLCRYLAHQNVYWLLRHWFTLRGLEFPGEKRALAHFREHEPELAGNIEAFFATTDVDRQIDLAHALTRAVLEPVGGAWREDEILAFGDTEDPRLQEIGRAVLADLLGAPGPPGIEP